MDFNSILERFSFERNDKEFRIKNLIILAIFLMLYLLNKYFLNSSNYFLMFHFNDLLAIVVLLSFLNIVYPLKLTNVWLIIGVTFFASFVWEYLALFIKACAVFDYLDILVYFLSMMIYLILLYFMEGKFNLAI